MRRAAEKLQNPRLFMSAPVLVALTLCAVGCGDSALTNEEATRLIRQQYPLSTPTVAGLREVGETTVARVDLSGTNLDFVFSLYDTGWLIDSVEAGDSSYSADEYRGIWLDRLLTPQEIELADYASGQSRADTLAYMFPNLEIRYLGPQYFVLGPVGSETDDPDSAIVVPMGDEVLTMFNLVPMGSVRTPDLVKTEVGWLPVGRELGADAEAVLTDLQRRQLRQVKIEGIAGSAFKWLPLMTKSEFEERLRDFALPSTDRFGSPLPW